MKKGEKKEEKATQHGGARAPAVTGSDGRSASGRVEWGSSGPLDLGVVQGGIVPVGTDELGVGAAFDDAPVFHTPSERDGNEGQRLRCQQRRSSRKKRANVGKEEGGARTGYGRLRGPGGGTDG